jgi:hypothetical protein
VGFELDNGTLVLARWLYGGSTLAKIAVQEVCRGHALRTRCSGAQARGASARNDKRHTRP